ncbi:MAG TPA: hemerythrin domain-containing protein [Phycisphaerae bacterium]|nr:hemerythrin domain-containing protein [Phycisphaerae bacterium]
MLRAEHKTILRVIAVLDKLVTRDQQGQGFERDALGKCVEFFRLFADACHHAKEEDLLFPMLESHGVPRDGGPIGVMLYEHQIARELTRAMGDALAELAQGIDAAREQFHVAARQYIQLLTNHIHKEDNVLFNIGDQVLPDQDRVSLCEQFCEVGCRQFEGKKVEQLEAIATDLETKWLVE